MKNGAILPLRSIIVLITYPAMTRDFLSFFPSPPTFLLLLYVFVKFDVIERLGNKG